MADYVDLLGRYDFYMPLTTDDTVLSAGGWTVTKNTTGKNPFNFVSDTPFNDGTGKSVLLNSSHSNPYTFTSSGTSEPADGDTGYTFEFWFKFDVNENGVCSMRPMSWLGSDNVNDSYPAINWGGSTGNRWHYPLFSNWTTSGRTTVYDENEVLSINAPRYLDRQFWLTPNVWYLYTLVQRGTTLTIFINGMEAWSQTVTGNFSQRTNMFRLGIGDTNNYSIGSMKIAHVVQWNNTAQKQKDIIKRYKHVQNKTNYNDIVFNTSGLKYWKKMEDRTGNSDVINNLGAAQPIWGTQFGSQTQVDVGRHYKGFKQTTYINNTTNGMNFSTLYGTDGNVEKFEQLLESGNYSIEFWYKPTILTTGGIHQHFIIFPFSGSTYIVLRNAGASLRPGFSITINNQVTTSTPNDTTITQSPLATWAKEEWHHFVFTSQWNSTTGAGKWKVWHDGTLDREIDFTAFSNADVGEPASLKNKWNNAGTWTDNTMTSISFGFSGIATNFKSSYYDDFILYDRALTKTEVQNRFYAEYMPEYQNMKYYENAKWRQPRDARYFDGQQWRTFEDSQGHKIWNGTSWVDVDL